MFRYNIILLFTIFVGLMFNNVDYQNYRSLSDESAINFDTNEKSFVLPLKNVGNLILIDAIIDGTLGTFVFDTGAQGIVLNATYFRDAKKYYNSSAHGITGTAFQKQTKKIEELKVGGITLRNFSADVVDLGHIENSKNIKIHGLIGAWAIKDFEATLDLKALRLTLRSIDKKGDLIERYVDNVKYETMQKVQLVNNILITTIPINGKKVCFCLDTGAEHNVIDVDNHDKIMETITVTSRRILRGAGNAKVEVLYGLMNDFEINNMKFEPMKTLLTDMTELRSGYAVNVYGMLGFDFFRQGIVKINCRKKTMHIATY